MQPIDRFTLERIPISSDDDPVCSRLVEGGVERAVVEGAWLEGQFALGGGRVLLLTTNDVPFEETANLVLLDERFALLDAYHIAQPYTPGMVEDVRADGGVLSFSFMGDRFTVRARESPGLTVALARPFGVWRGPAPWRPAHLTIRSEPDVERAEEAGA